ncbi:GIY-YIG nuclease family protein [Phenylobacterium sp.]|jgi:hypothetical protein|uniref:GIY-YIG nuclease family protein n=1 Tax=Phenylobacterium sp. TaxID=1871053 RepID=UPI002F3F286D
MTEPLRRGWYSREIDADKLQLAGIYLWTIGDDALYVGQARRLRSRIRQYPNNVRRLLAGLPYRKAKPSEYRKIHVALAEAYNKSSQVTVSVLEVCEPELLNERERYWIDRHRTEAKRRGCCLLNSSLDATRE